MTIVPSSLSGYCSGYSVSVDFRNQVDILRSYWPQLNPDPALRYIRDVYEKRKLPEWVEGLFVYIRSGFFSNRCDEELVEVLHAVTKSLGGKFYNFLSSEDQIDLQHPYARYLRQSKPHRARLRISLNRQKKSDLLIIPAQFGIRYKGRSVEEVSESLLRDEDGIGVKDGATMLLTHPNRLQCNEDLSVDLLGDEVSPRGKCGPFSHVPFFSFCPNRNMLRLDYRSKHVPWHRVGSASVLLEE